MNQPPIVCLLGNSVPLLMQPFRTGPDEKTYTEHLRDQGFLMVNSAKQSAVVTDLYRFFEDECIRHFPDFVILHFGIVEATWRVRPRWLQNVFSMNAWNNSIINKGYNSPISRGIKFVSKKVYKQLVERACFALGLKTRWVGPRHFQFVLRDVAKRIFSDTPTRKIILIGMTPVADWVERQTPGTNKSIEEYNQLMRDIAGEYSNITFLDTSQLFADTPVPFSVDGIHLNAAGHRELATGLSRLLQGERSDYTGWQGINQYQKLYRFYEHWNKRSTSRSK